MLAMYLFKNKLLVKAVQENKIKCYKRGGQYVDY
jgi:hypothetical protein